MRMRLSMKTVVKVAFCEDSSKRWEREGLFPFLFLVSCSMGHPQPTSLCSPGLFKCHKLSPTLFQLRANTHIQTHLHTQHEKEKVGCGLLGAVPTQNKKTFSPLLPIHLACNSKMVKLTGMSPSFKNTSTIFPTNRSVVMFQHYTTKKQTPSFRTVVNLSKFNPGIYDISLSSVTV